MKYRPAPESTLIPQITTARPVEARIEESEELAAIARFLQSLDGFDTLLLWARFGRGMSHSAIAERFSLPMNSVGRHIRELLG